MNLLTLFFFFFSFFDERKGGQGRSCVTHPLGRDHKDILPLENVGLSHSYCDWGVIDLTLAPQES